MRLVQTALCAGPAINLPRRRTEHRHRLLFPNRLVLCCLSLPSHSHQVVVSSRTTPPHGGWRRSKLMWSLSKSTTLISFSFILSSLPTSVSYPLPFPHHLLSAFCTRVYFSTLYSAAICPTSCSLFVLMCLFWCFITLNPTSRFLSGTPFAPSPSFVVVFFPLADSPLALVCPASPRPPASCSQVRTDIHSCAHTHPPLSPPAGCTCVPGFGPDTAQVAVVESGKCLSCPIRRPKQVKLQTTWGWTRQKTDSRNSTHSKKANTSSRMLLLAFKSLT